MKTRERDKVKIKFGRLYSDGKIMRNGVLNIENGRISDIADSGEYDLDLSAYMLVPGFIDMHTHGAVGIESTFASEEELQKLSLFYAENGVTGFCATTVSSSLEVVDTAVRTISSARKKGVPGAELLGVYLEGPYIAPEFKGAHDEKLLRGPDLEELKKIVASSNGALRVFALAPELPGAEEAIRYLTSEGVRVSCGHSAATCEEAMRGFKAGASITVHTYNAMKGLHHRDVGLLGASLVSDDTYNEIICDLIHVSKEAVEIVFRAKPQDKIVLITDSMCATGMEDGSYTIGKLPITVKDGVARTESGALAGSSLRMNVAVKNLCEGLGLPLERVILAATKNPAEALGLSDVGSIKKGYRANLTALKDDFSVALTMVDGKTVYKTI